MSGKISWDTYFLQAAVQAATRSSCSRRQVGAVAVREHRQLATGYNGTPHGVRDCNDGGCPRCASTIASGEALGECVCLHAEENVVVQGARLGIPLIGATVYSTHQPCLICTRMLINVGVLGVLYLEPYPAAAVEHLAKQARFFLLKRSL